MYIKSIVLDGFKSYGERTEITGFDSQFNAITGLNGTGKSNILDSICFVLGITQLINVRAGTLQDLVYKGGQAGVTRATVSITFDNRDKNQCPVGFHEYEEITVTRTVVMGSKNKYMINGMNVQPKRIHDMFCSVQLNVNNPHFLIMQGRITKVLNMKPPEILSMIEEAAGTRQYELKKQISQKTVDKKDAKLKELNDLINEEITPKLSKLREERRLYMEFKRVERELELNNAIYMAWQCVQARKLMVRCEEDLEKKTNLIENLEENINTNKAQAAKLEQEIKEYEQNNSENKAELATFEEAVKVKGKILAKANATEHSAKENIATEEKKKKQLTKSLREDEATLKSKEAEMAKLNDMFQTLKESEATDTEAFAASQRKLEAVNAGMEIDDDGQAATLQEQLMNAKQSAAEAATQSKQAAMQLQHCQTQLKEKLSETGGSAADYKKDQHHLQNMEKEVDTIEKQLGKLNYSDNKMTELQEHKNRLRHECRSLQEKVDRFEMQHPHANFAYKAPDNFNKRSVKGKVCCLFTLKDNINAQALETAAGGKLYNVVVDNDNTGKKLLQHGNLQYRTTFIPLNKIRGSTIPEHTVQYAQKLVGKENVQTALSLIQYDKELQPAMEYIFGGVFICRDMNTARKVTFDNNIKRKCVTLEGDVTDPSGTLSGGARHKGASVLLQLDGIKKFQNELLSKKQELTKIETEMQNLGQVADKYANLKQKLELRQHELSVIQKRLQQTSHYRHQEDIDNLKKTIAELSQQVKDCTAKEKTSSAKAREIENRIKDSVGHRERQLKEAEAEMKRLKKQAEHSKNLWKQKEQDYESLKLEISELQKALETAQEQIRGSDQHIEELKVHLEEAQAAAQVANEAAVKAQEELKQYKSAISAKNKELQSKLKQKADLCGETTECELQIATYKHEIKDLEKQCRDYKARGAELSKKIKKDDPRMKDAETMTDAEAQKLCKKISQEQQLKNTLSRNVNAKAQSMFDQEEKQYTDLQKRRVTIEQDRQKLLKVIADLDKKKLESLTVAWQQITKDFGSIFKTLLPGTDAKLQPPPGKALLDGLEIKVALGGIWKESLSELSGGQKSLVALSLILSMLLFKPAPLYILDEIDAALDLSHTQNIGNMLRKHFGQSQFIIVSLKDGMFSNANVLFRTKFVDGMSTVTRTVNTRQQR